ncbi:flagellar hook-associated protein FlgK [Cronobacter malonaticus]|uniref:flagellar hook-associated protein FlgK n=1 Tax=Cronobacter malonaticus TaxID=413503 RepID=UPI000517FCD2|nr:flagellar hook-associated protein FlgK [Cronobacter malonaticus]EGT4371901.1 flagellar hook-associated protein FlgK [Cronobacter malonaticus]ELY6227100.1 flagellar hook-associated protein FlgK [Cronobacter malonaticus]MDI6469255.1 flagellar hook-associated protein FlgK [Cronobacter malonaticus]MDK1176449.1 flagellar hook-associated protein FlgK [Cronobacter malonaticus]MDK1688493.1 flagellar hook-associated protein FlgK [Cronobacter malonaticus]
MSSSLINSAMSGLSAAQTALSTVSNNISNYNVAGYTRQTTVLGQSNSTMTQGGWVGNGVYVSGIQREYDAFITNQLNAAQNQSSGLTTRYEQMSKIDDMVSGTTNNISTTMQDFFKSLQTLASNAEDPAARQTLLGKADGLVNQFKVVDQYLRDQDKQVNTAVAASVQQINNYATQIASLNEQITRLTGMGAGASPNDLLDQRDQLVSELNKIVGVDVSVQDGNTFNVTMANGYNLVQGSKASQVAAVPSSADPARTTIAFVDKTAGNIEIPEKLVTTGSLGGLFAFRREDLDQARNNLGQIALAFGDAFNKQHEAGFDANGDAGKAFFKLGSAEAMSNSRNTGSASLSATITDSSAVKASDYQMAFDGSNWKVTRLSDNVSVNATPTTDGAGNVTALEFDGLKIDISGAAANKDTFTVKPVSNVIISMDVNIHDESEIAMASDATSGESDNRNGKALLDLQNSKVVGGSKTFNDAYAAFISEVGNKTNTLKSSSTTQTNVVTQLTNQQQSISGVNLDEEYGNLQRYQQYYMANAQVLQTASALFDALLQIR